MRKALTIGTIGILAVAVAVMAVAGITAPRTSATTSLCHSTALSIKAAASVKAGKSITVTGAEAKAPAHSVRATLQSRLSTFVEVGERRVRQPHVGRRLLAQVEGARQEGQVQGPRARLGQRRLQYVGGQDGDGEVEPGWLRRSDQRPPPRHRRSTRGRRRSEKGTPPALEHPARRSPPPSPDGSARRPPRVIARPRAIRCSPSWPRPSAGEASRWVAAARDSNIAHVNARTWPSCPVDQPSGLGRACARPPCIAGSQGAAP